MSLTDRRRGGEEPDFTETEIILAERAWDRVAVEDQRLSKANYAAEHAPHNMTVAGKEYKGGEFLPTPASPGGHGLPEVAPHHRKVAYREVPKVARDHPGHPIDLDHADPSLKRKGTVLTRWSVAGQPAAMVVHDPDRGHRLAASPDHDEDDAADAHANPFSVLSPYGDVHDEHGWHPTREKAEAQAREVATEERRQQVGVDDEATVPAGESLTASLPKFDHDTHDVRFREKRLSKAELTGLAEADRDAWLASHSPDEFGSKAEYVAAMKAHVAGRLPAPR